MRGLSTENVSCQCDDFVITERPSEYSGCVNIETGERYADEQQREQAEAQARKEQIESQFSAWNGSHRELESFIKESMHDPGSYEHVETLYWDHGDYLVVQTKFRGANAFGGIVINSLKARVSLEGQIIEVVERP